MPKMSNKNMSKNINHEDLKDHRIPKRSVLDRVFEIVPGGLTWLVLTSPIWLALNLPAFMAYFILFLDVYWFYRAIKTTVLSLVGYKKMQKAIATDWIALLDRDYPLIYKGINHVFIIPSWKESGNIIETNLEGIANSDYDLKKIRVILALEERDDLALKEEKRAVAEKYRSVFANVYVTEHPKDLEGEVIGPGSNRTWALKNVLPELVKEIDISNTILTTLDSDFVVHPKLVGALTHTYLSTPNPSKKSFTGVFIYSNNYWQAPAPMRIIASSLTLTQLSELVESWKYINFSSHSINLQTLIDLGFWTIDHVNDDSHLYWKAYFEMKGEYRVVPYWIPISADTVLDQTLYKTFVNQYKQLQRWAYGVEHRPFIYKNVLKRGDISVVARAERLLYVLRSDLIWATVAFITGFGGIVALAVNPAFANTVLGRNLVFYSGAILTIAIVGLIPASYLNHKILPPVPREWSRARRIWGIVQVVLSPIVLMTFGTIPAIDSQTRLMFGKYLTYRVTRKHRVGQENT